MTNQTIQDFTLPSTSGKTFILSEQRGKNLVIYFYPKDSTPGCTTQGQQFRDFYQDMKKTNTQIVGISRNNIK